MDPSAYSLSGLPGPGGETRFLVGAVGLLALCFVLSLGALAGIVRAVTGWEVVAITSASMEPTIAVGDLVFIRSAGSDDLRPGHVITYRPDGGGSPITHRIVRIDQTTGHYTTRGDATIHNDSTPVRPDQIAGRGAVLIPFLGYPAYFRDHGAWQWLAAVFLAMAGTAWIARWAVLPAFDPWPRRPLWWV